MVPEVRSLAWQVEHHDVAGFHNVYSLFVIVWQSFSWQLCHSWDNVERHMNSLFVTLREYGTVGYDERVGIWQEDAEQTFW